MDYRGHRPGGLWYLPQAVAVESNAFQYLLAPEFDRQCRERRLPPLPIHLIEQRTPKFVRIERLGTFFQRQKIRIKETPGSRILYDQLRAFPQGDHDDGPDALELAIRMLQTMAAGGYDDQGDGFWGVARA